MLSLNDPKKFANTLLNEVLTHGFQSLGKRDLELLIFYLLERDGYICKNSRNYEVSKLLRIPEGRLKLLRKDSYARWQTIDNINSGDIIRGVFSQCFSEEKIKQSFNHASASDKKDGFIPILIEHPADRAEFESEVIIANGIPKYERNREVLLVRFDIVIDIAKKYNILKDEKEIEKNLKKINQSSTTLAELLRSDISKLGFGDFRSALNDTLIKLITKPVEAEGVSIYSFLSCLF